MDLFPALLSCTVSGATHSYELQILDITDTNTAAVVQHQFIGVDGGLLEHMGNRPRQISFRAYFFGLQSQIGTTIPADYDNHARLLADLSDSRLSVNWQLSHPKYGILPGSVMQWIVVHDDTQDYVAIDITFVVDGTTNVSLQTRNLFEQTETNQLMAAMNDNIFGTNGNLRSLGYSSLLNRTINMTQRISDQVAGVNDSVRSFVNEIDNTIDVFDNLFANIVAPMSILERTANFVSDVPSKIILSMQKAINRMIQSGTAVANSPYLFVNNLTTGMATIWDSLVSASGPSAPPSHASFWMSTWAKTSAISLIDEVFKKIKSDNDKRIKSIAVQSFRLDGVRTSVKMPVMLLTTNDLTNILIITRTYVNSALLLDRENNSLKSLIADLTLYLDQVRIDRPSIRKISVSDMPVHALTVQLGRPYSYAEDILSLNPWITNPSFITGEVSYVG